MADLLSGTHGSVLQIVGPGSERIPRESKVTWTGTATAKPKLHVLAIGINKYIDTGSIAPYETEIKLFPPLGLAVPDAKAIAEELKKAGQDLYGDAHVRAMLDEGATSAKLDAVVSHRGVFAGSNQTFVCNKPGSAEHFGIAPLRSYPSPNTQEKREFCGYMCGTVVSSRANLQRTPG